MRIFISSTSEMAEEREIARDAILSAGHIPVMWEYFPATTLTVQEILNRSIQQCDAVLTILGTRMGTMVHDVNVPGVIFETQLAESFGKPVFFFIRRSGLISTKHAIDNRPSYGALLGKIAESRVISSYDSKAEFKKQVILALKHIKEPAFEGDETSVILLSKITKKDIKYLIEHPEELEIVSPRDFENMVAELLKADGWAVDLVKRNNAPGPDIIAVSSKFIEGVPVKLIVECKRHSQSNPVDISIVRNVMYWVNEEFRATMGMIATTSRFTSAAQQQAKEHHQWRLDLRDQTEIISWLKRHQEIEFA